MSLPSFESITNSERQTQQNRAIGTTLVGHVAQVGEYMGLAKNEMERRRQEYRRNVINQIRQEGQIVAQRLAQAGEPHDLELKVTNVSQGRLLRKDKSDIGKKSVTRGWILTPPIDLRMPPTPDRPHSNPDHQRYGFALGVDGQIYTYSVSKPLQRKSHRERTIEATGFLSPDESIVKDKQIALDQSQADFAYEDQIAFSYGESGTGNFAGIPEPGHDDITLIHGLGIRQALGALNVRSGYVGTAALPMGPTNP